MRTVLRLALPVLLTSALLAVPGTAQAASVTISPIPAGRTIDLGTFTESFADGTSITTTRSAQLDAAGRQILNTRISTDGADLVIQTNVISSVYDAAGHVLRTVEVFDNDGDGPGLPIATTTTSAYDSRGQVTSITFSVDDDADGIIDSSSSATFGSDRRGRTVRIAFSQDGDGDGQPDFAGVETKTFDSRGNLLSDTTTFDDLGTPESPDSQVSVVNTYSGTLLISSLVTNSGSGGLSMQTMARYTYDAKGHVLTITTVETGFDGSQSTSTVTST